MTLEKLQIDNFLKSEKEILKVTKELKKIFDFTTTRLDNELKKNFSEFKLVQYQNINAIIDKLNSDSLQIMGEGLENVLSNSYRRSNYVLNLGEDWYAFRDLSAKTIFELSQNVHFGVNKIVSLQSVLQENFTTFKRQIGTAITSGISSGQSYLDISKTMTQFISADLKNSKGLFYKLKRIARTEGHRLHETAGRLAREEAIYHGIDVEKIWLATLDSETREDHVLADGQRVGANESFIVGGENLDFAGDPAGSAENVIHCRCTTANVKKGQSLQQRAYRDPQTGKTKTFSFRDYQGYLKFVETQGVA